MVVCVRCSQDYSVSVACWLQPRSVQFRMSSNTAISSAVPFSTTSSQRVCSSATRDTYCHQWALTRSPVSFRLGVAWGGTNHPLPAKVINETFYVLIPYSENNYGIPCDCAREFVNVFERMVCLITSCQEKPS